MPFTQIHTLVPRTVRGAAAARGSPLSRAHPRRQERLWRGERPLLREIRADVALAHCVAARGVIRAGLKVAAIAGYTPPLPLLLPLRPPPTTDPAPSLTQRRCARNGNRRALSCTETICVREQMQFLPAHLTGGHHH